jgi:hypothetical protein
VIVEAVDAGQNGGKAAGRRKGEGVHVDVALVAGLAADLHAILLVRLGIELHEALRRRQPGNGRIVVAGHPNEVLEPGPAIDGENRVEFAGRGEHHDALLLRKRKLPPDCRMHGSAFVRLPGFQPTTEIIGDEHAFADAVGRVREGDGPLDVKKKVPERVKEEEKELVVG